MVHKTPGVYIEEISKFPPSVAQVETAIPAFVGYTQKGSAEPTRISSMLEYETIFGQAANEVNVKVSIVDGVATATLAEADKSKYKMYYALQMFFANGGGPCYIVSVGKYTDTITGSVIVAGLAKLVKEDEPTLLVFPDAVSLDEANAKTLHEQALLQCSDLQDRFVIMDTVKDTDASVTELRKVTGDLKYGAAYYPHLETVLSYAYDDTKIVVTSDVTINNASGTAISSPKMSDLKIANSGLYNQAKASIAGIRVIVAPSGAMAGVYARVDSDRGVHKAPANVGLNYVIAPTVKISHKEQEGLNVDPVAGKSINAIRTFTGKGTLVWGARTLDGNSNEWRYVPVRRFFNMVEESVQKASSRFVFEPNTANTWVRIQGMIENFLTQQWKAGALAGAKPEEAFYVSVGLGATMSALDVQEGRMIIEIGMAAVRPAEFIVLRFSHKLQEA
ncbi:MAG: phage tail sheath family protein [Flavobacteriaceae bacterium]|nr:phage tail sheath family protein [Flavobacteriaceae bacterium]